LFALDLTAAASHVRRVGRARAEEFCRRLKGGEYRFDLGRNKACSESAGLLGKYPL
jgi:hypothetical protein